MSEPGQFSPEQIRRPVEFVGDRTHTRNEGKFSAIPPRPRESSVEEDNKSLNIAEHKQLYSEPLTKLSETVGSRKIAENLFPGISIRYEFSPTGRYGLEDSQDKVLILVPSDALDKLSNSEGLENIRYVVDKRLFDHAKAIGKFEASSKRVDFYSAFKDGKEYALSKYIRNQRNAPRLLNDNFDALRPDAYERNPGDLAIIQESQNFQKDLQRLEEFFADKPNYDSTFFEENDINIASTLASLTASIRADLRLDRAILPIIPGKGPSIFEDLIASEGGYQPPTVSLSDGEYIYVSKDRLKAHSVDSLLNLLIIHVHEHFHAYQFRHDPEMSEDSKYAALDSALGLSNAYQEDPGEKEARMYSFQRVKQFIQGYSGFSDAFKVTLLQRLTSQESVIKELALLPIDS